MQDTLATAQKFIEALTALGHIRNARLVSRDGQVRIQTGLKGEYLTVESPTRIARCRLNMQWGQDIRQVANDLGIESVVEDRKR